MKVRLLKTEGKGYFEEVEWELPPLKSQQIRVEAIMTGVCRSDIDMMMGKFKALPDHMQGHEGLGRIIDMGHRIKDHDYGYKIGDIVATRGEPAYADVYNCDYGNFVVVPEVHPRYILEPVACGINLLNRMTHNTIAITPNFSKSRIAVLGSGFLAWVAVHYLKKCYHRLDIEVITRSNRDLCNTIYWSEHARICPEMTGQYDLIIDLSSQTEYLNQDSFNPNATVIIGSEKHPGASMNFSHLLWNNCKMFFPSPRDEGFHQCMKIAEELISNGTLNVDRFWTRAYCRDTEWRQAFEDGLNRAPDYSRGYIWWKNG